MGFIFGIVKLAFSLLWLFVTIVVLVSIWREKKDSLATKIIWTLVVLLMPYLGPLLWLVFGKESQATV